MFDFLKRHKGSDATIPNGAPVVLELDPKLAEALEQVEETLFAILTMSLSVRRW